MPFKQGHLRYFVVVAEEGQITLAARRLQIAQPALSQAIAQLEAEVGLALFVRHARGVTPTAAGAALLPRARAALNAEAEAVRTAEALARSAAGTIAFGYLGIPPALITPDLTDAFAAEHPNVAISFHDLPYPSASPVSWLGDVDVALVGTTLLCPGLVCVPLRAEERWALLPSTHPLCDHDELALDDVLEETFIGFDASVEPTWAGFWSLDDHRGGPPANLAPDRASTAHDRFTMMTHGAGISIVPAAHAALLTRVNPNMAAIPIRGARPAVVSLLAREERDNPLADALIEIAERIGADALDRANLPPG